MVLHLQVDSPIKNYLGTVYTNKTDMNKLTAKIPSLFISFLSCHTHLNGSYNLICSRSFVKTSFHIFFCNPINFPSFQTKVRPATLHCHSRTKILLKSSEPAKIFILHYTETKHRSSRTSKGTFMKVLLGYKINRT